MRRITSWPAFCKILCLSLLLLYNIIQIEQLETAQTHIILFSPWIRSLAQLGCVFCSESQTPGYQLTAFLFEALEKNPSSSSLNCWKRWFFWNCWTEIPIPLMIISRGCSQLLGSPCIPWHMVLYIFKASNGSKNDASFASDFSDFCHQTEKASAFKGSFE